MEWSDFAEELSVPFSNSSRTVYADMIAMMGTNFYDNTSFLPLSGILATLVLDCYLVTRLERLERFAVV